MKYWVVVFFLVSTLCRSQSSSPEDWWIKHRETNRRGMMVLSGFSLGSAISGGIGMSRGSGMNKYFHEMNLYWSGVNLVLAIPGLIKSYKPFKGELNNFSAFKLQNQTEKIFLFNTALDVAYMSTGTLMNALGEAKADDRLKGYGLSILFQGAFLCVFDGFMYAVHQRNYKKRLEPQLKF